MSYNKTMGTSAKPAIGDQGYAIAIPCSHKRRGRLKHFWHTGSAFWPLVTDYNNISMLYFEMRYAFKQRSLAIENPGRSGEVLPFLTGDFSHTATFSQITVENTQMTSGF